MVTFILWHLQGKGSGVLRNERRKRSHPVGASENDRKKLAFGWRRFDSLADLLSLQLVLVVVPGAYCGVHEAAEEEEEADEKHDARHSTVESVSSSHGGSLCHEITLMVYPAFGRCPY